MSRRLFYRRYCCAWAICLACAAIGLQGAEQRPGRGRSVRSIEVTEPRNEIPSTNVNQLREPNGLKSLEDDLSRPLQSFRPGDSLEGIGVRPMTPPTIRSTRSKDSQDRRRNWMFATPEELILGTAPEDERDGKYKDLSPMERYIERLSAGRKGNTNQPGTGGLNWRKPSESWEGPLSGPEKSIEIPDEFSSTERSLRKLFDSGPTPGVFAPGVAPSGFVDLFKFNSDRMPTPETLRIEREHKTRIENFKKIWDLPSARTPVFAPASSSFGTPSWGVNNSAAPQKPVAPLFGAPGSSIAGLPAPAAPALITPAVTPPLQQQRMEFGVPRRQF